MFHHLTRRDAGIALLSTLGATAIMSTADQAAAATSSKQYADRKAILAMAGNFHVRFDFRETVSFRPDYDPLEPKLSNGNEVVSVIEDRENVIRLQHILVIETEGKTILVKHWRQDWIYEPKSVLRYTGPNTWRIQQLPAAQRKNLWSQTVWQTDDSPRYGGVGAWRHEDGESSWLSDFVLRPLARRDAVRKPPFNHYRGTNRHAITPTGWVQEQDNAKIGLADGKPATFVHEVVMNTYDHASDFKVSAATEYWAKTKTYWDAVRADWDAVIAKNNGVVVDEEAQAGSVTGPKLMEWADAIADGSKSESSAIAEAKAFITASTTAP